MEQNLQHDFPKMRGGGGGHRSTAVWIFSGKFIRYGDVIRPKGRRLDLPNSEEIFLKAQLGCSHPSKHQVPRSLLSFLKTEWFYLAFTFCHCSAMVCPGNFKQMHIGPESRGILPK